MALVDYNAYCILPKVSAIGGLEPCIFSTLYVIAIGSWFGGLRFPEPPRSSGMQREVGCLKKLGASVGMFLYTMALELLVA